MTTALEVAPHAPSTGDGWRVHGHARIDERLGAPCVLVVRADGTWSAEVATFTLAGTVDLFLVSTEGGHFCGPADVERSRADSHPFAMRTVLRGSGPLLVVAPGTVQPELPSAEVILDAEVVED